MIQQAPDTSSYSRFDFLHYNLGLPNGTVGKETACNARDTSWSLDREDPMEEEMATHSSILACLEI